MNKKNILLGVAGGIAVYKAADLCSKLARDFNVLVVMTPNAQKLISERIFMTLSGNPVLTDLFTHPDPMPGHIGYAARADLMLVAPATVDFIGKYTHGIADDPLTSTAVAFRKTVLLAPAANSAMLGNPACLENIEILKKRGVRFVGPADGHLACGDVGRGRMSEPSEIAEEVRKLLGDSAS